MLQDITAVEKAKFSAQSKLGRYDPDYEGSPGKLTAKQEAILNGQADPANYLTGSVRMAKNLSTNAREILATVEAMSPATRENYLKKGNNEYQYELSRFENDSLNNELSAVDRYEKLLWLGQLKIKTKYSNEARELYELSKVRLNDFLGQNKVKKSVIDELLAMDNELYSKGFVAYAKFKNGLGSGGGGGGGGGKPKKIPIKTPVFGSFSLVSPPSSPTPDISDVMNDYKAAIGRIGVLQTNLPPESTSNIEIAL